MSEVRENKITPRSGTSVQIGEAGDTINLTTATVNLPTGVGGTSWQAIKTSTYTASAGEGVFANTTSGAFTVNLPSQYPTLAFSVGGHLVVFFLVSLSFENLNKSLRIS